MHEWGQFSKPSSQLFDYYSGNWFSDNNSSGLTNNDGNIPYSDTSPSSFLVLWTNEEKKRVMYTIILTKLQDPAKSRAKNGYGCQSSP